MSGEMVASVVVNWQQLSTIHSHAGADVRF